MSMYTSGVRKILFPSNAATNREAFFALAESAGYTTVAWNSEIWIRIGSAWHRTIFETHDFRVVLDTE